MGPGPPNVKCRSKKGNLSTSQLLLVVPLLTFRTSACLGTTFSATTSVVQNQQGLMHHDSSGGMLPFLIFNGVSVHKDVQLKPVCLGR